MASANKSVGVLVGGEQGSRTRHRAQSPVAFRSAPARSFEPRQGRGGGFLVADVCRGLDEFEETPAVETQILVLTALTRSGEGLFVPTETVEQDGSGESGQADQSAFAPGGSVGRGRLDQLDRIGGCAPPRREVQRVVFHRRVARRLR